jgi:hypothetical protein
MARFFRMGHTPGEQRRRRRAARRRIGAPFDRGKRRDLQCVRRQPGPRPALGSRSPADSADRRGVARNRTWRRTAGVVVRRAAADLYGPQRLLCDGTIPAELPFGHPNFLWPCHGITPAGGRRLHVYAVDISRSADGRWWALADRTQTPSGPGYALENRQIVSRVFPDLLGDLGVRSLGGFFVALRENLLRQAPSTTIPTWRWC